MQMVQSQPCSRTEATPKQTSWVLATLKAFRKVFDFLHEFLST